MAEIGRVLTAMVTPFGEESLRVHLKHANKLALALLNSGSDGLVIAGTTGESPTLSHEEKLALFRTVKDAVGSKGVIIGGTGSNDTADTIEFSQRAKDTLDGFLLPVPSYNKPSQEGLYQHFKVVATAVRKPCILYNIPSRTGVNMTAETMLRLAHDIPNIVGIKEASGDLVQIATIIEGAPKRFRVWSGDDAMTLPILAIGGYGVIGVSSHLVGNQMKEIIHDYLSGSRKKAADAHRRLLPLIQVLMTAASNPTPVKFALNQIGFPVGPPRLPLVEPDEETGEKIMVEVRRYTIDLKIP